MDPEVIQILGLSEALASFRHTYLGSFFLDPEDIRKLSTGAIWNFVIFYSIHVPAEILKERNQKKRISSAVPLRFETAVKRNDATWHA